LPAFGERERNEADLLDQRGKNGRTWLPAFSARCLATTRKTTPILAHNAQGPPRCLDGPFRAGDVSLRSSGEPNDPVAELLSVSPPGEVVGASISLFLAFLEVI
jgi:hypothetical protein